MKKKYQIFISSTYTDLLEERQAVVQTVLRAGHIPAGMELFSAGDKSQLEIIKKWIQESDIFVLILGGRYGSIESESGFSYTELEYRHAIELGKPFFAIVMEDSLLDIKNTKHGKSVLELENPQKYKEFRSLVLSKVCRFFNDIGDIKTAVFESLMDIITSQDNLVGWIKSNEIQTITPLLKTIEILNKEKEVLVAEVEKLRYFTSTNQIGEHSFEDIKAVLMNNKIEVSPNLGGGTNNILELFFKYKAQLIKGVQSYPHTHISDLLVDQVIPLLMNFNLVQKTMNHSFIITTLGHKFLSLIELENLKK